VVGTVREEGVSERAHLLASGGLRGGLALRDEGRIELSLPIPDELLHFDRG
jgi:hypothetical protein